MATAAMAYGERRFGAAYTWRIFIVVVVGAILFGAWSEQGDPHIASHPTLFWISIAICVAGALLWIALGKSALVINDSGVRRESLFGEQEMAWSQIVETRYQVVPINVYAHFGLIGALIAMSSKKSGSAHLNLELIGPDRQKLKVTSNYRKADEAIGVILGRSLPPMVQSAKGRIQRGETVQFGELALSATAITWKGTPVPLSEITEAALVRSNLQIKRRGKWLSAVSVRSNKIPNVLVFLEVLEALAPQIKSTGVDPLAHVRI